MSDPRIDEILGFWFGDDPAATLDHGARWWRKDPDFDQEIRDRFMETWRQGVLGQLDAWADDGRGRLALIIVLDQFSRNMFRGTPRSFAQDTLAMALALEGHARGLDRGLGVWERLFFIMPLMHAEDLHLQRMCMEVIEALAAQATGRDAEAMNGSTSAGARHLEIIERFGRFPHRNDILGRPSTPQEVAFLKEPNSSF